MKPVYGVWRQVDNQSGMALLITIAVATVLVAVSVELHRRVYTAATIAAANRYQVNLNQMATSGVHAAIGMLIRDKQTTRADSVQEDWANKEKINLVSSEMPFDDGRLTVKISDERARIQINALVAFPEGRLYQNPQKLLWERFLGLILPQYETDESVSPEGIVDAIKDWLDSGDDDAISGLNGAESDYYRQLDPPYECSNAPMQHIGELALVKGVSTQLMNGNKSIAGLKDIITVNGLDSKPGKRFVYDGRININTAGLEVLAALMPLGRQDLAAVIVQYREAADPGGYLNDLTQPNWYKKMPGFSGIDIDPALVTTESDIFRIESTAYRHGFSQRVIAVITRIRNVQKGVWQYRVLRWIVKYNIEG